MVAYHICRPTPDGLLYHVCRPTYVGRLSCLLPYPHWSLTMYVTLPRWLLIMYVIHFGNYYVCRIITLVAVLHLLLYHQSWERVPKTLSRPEFPCSSFFFLRSLFPLSFYAVFLCSEHSHSLNSYRVPNNFFLFLKCFPRSQLFLRS